MLTFDNKDKTIMDNSNHFSNDELKVTIEHLPNCEIKLTAEAAPKLILSAKEVALKQVAKEVSIPGFRKGKVPLDMLEKQFAGSIREKTLQELAELTFRKAAELAKAPVLNAQAKIDFDLKSFDPNMGSTMTFQYEVEPKTPMVSIEEISFPDLEKEAVTDSKIDETIESIRKYFSILDVVEDRPVQEGDFIVLDIEDIDSNPPQKVFNHMRFEVSDKGMAEWMKELVCGMSKGASKEGISRPNTTDSEEIKKEYQPKKVRVTVHEIQTSKLPDIDETLAKKVGVETIEEMRAQLAKQLENRSEMDHQDAMREKLCELLLEKYPFELPKSLVKKEYEHRMQFLHNDRNFSKTWKTMSFDEQEQMKAKTLKESENAIRLFYLFRKVMLDHKVKLSLPEQKKNPINMIEAMFMRNQDKDYEQSSEEERAIILSKSMLSSAQDYLLEKLAELQKA